MTLLEGPKRLKTITLRPFSFGTLEACERLGLTLFTTANGSQGMDPAEIRRQIISFAWVQSESPETVVSAFTSGTAEREISLFQFGVELSELDALVAEVTRIAETIKAASVEVQEKPSRSNGETPPPNL